ncbi:hypothetical protein XENOCAPTIV_012186 [Xenoophorus captivus]|uniref:Anaphase-promoting complex subunit 1 C-terminal domain-containing protein n=1 Tax=Xenoophorus captivus TaxID=1517983 RepID=A0ABV0RC59_9TELE
MHWDASLVMQSVDNRCFRPLSIIHPRPVDPDRVYQAQTCVPAATQGSTLFSQSHPVAFSAASLLNFMGLFVAIPPMPSQLRTLQRERPVSPQHPAPLDFRIMIQLVKAHTLSWETYRLFWKLIHWLRTYSYHLQALRHLAVLAAEPRLLLRAGQLPYKDDPQGWKSLLATTANHRNSGVTAFRAVGALRQGDLQQTFPLWQLRLVVELWDSRMLRGPANKRDTLLTSEFLPVMKNAVDVALDNWLKGEGIVGWVVVGD